MTRQLSLLVPGISQRLVRDSKISDQKAVFGVVGNEGLFGFPLIWSKCRSFNRRKDLEDGIGQNVDPLPVTLVRKAGGDND